MLGIWLPIREFEWLKDPLRPDRANLNDSIARANLNTPFPNSKGTCPNFIARNAKLNEQVAILKDRLHDNEDFCQIEWTLYQMDWKKCEVGRENLYLYFTDTLNFRFLVTLTWEKDVSIYIVIIDFICVI